jgi:zinc protease
MIRFPATRATAEELPNRLHLILDPDDSFPVVSVHAWVANGSIHEGRHLGAGVSHFLEHMVFKGTRDWDSGGLSRAVQEAGGQWNAYTTFDHTLYHIDGPSDSLGVFLKALSGMVFFPTLPEEEFERERDVIRREIDMGLDDPHSTAARLLFETAWTRDPRRHPVIGHRNRFDALSHADLSAFHAERYTPSNVHFVVSGRFDPDTLRESLGKLTADAADPAAPEPNAPADPPQCAPRRGHATFRVPTTRLFLAWQTPALDHPDAPALDLLAGILGSGRSARLYRRLREERELAVEIGAWNWAAADRPGLFAVQAECAPDRRDDLIEAILAEVSALASDPDPAELDKVRRLALSDNLRTLATASGRASALGANWLNTRDLDFTRRRFEALERIGTDDIRRLAASLVERRLTTAVLDPEKATPASAEKTARKSAAGPASRDPEVVTLENGLTLVRVPDDRLPLASVQLAARAGLPAESPATSGIGQLFAAMLPHGSAMRSGEEIAATLEARGARLGARSGFNTLMASCSGLAADLPLLLETLAELAAAPAFPEENLERERTSQLAALEESLDDPLTVALLAARAALFSGAGYGLDPTGTPESLAALDRDALLAHHQTHFGAGNLVAALVGDLREHDIDSLVARTLATLPEGTDWAPPASEIAPASAVARRLPKRQAAIAMSYATGPATDPDHAALDLLAHHCADMAGPLFTRIREELGLAYHVSASRLAGADASSFTFFLATSPEQAETAESALREEIAKIAASGLDAAALERTRNATLAGLALSLQQPSVLAMRIAADTLIGLGPRHPLELPGILRSVTPADTRAAAERWLSAEPSVAKVTP